MCGYWTIFAVFRFKIFSDLGFVGNEYFTWDTIWKSLYSLACFLLNNHVHIKVAWTVGISSDNTTWSNNCDRRILLLDPSDNISQGDGLFFVQVLCCHLEKSLFWRPGRPPLWFRAGCLWLFCLSLAALHTTSPVCRSAASCQSAPEYCDGINIHIEGNLAKWLRPQRGGGRNWGRPTWHAEDGERAGLPLYGQTRPATHSNHERTAFGSERNSQSKVLIKAVERSQQTGCCALCLGSPAFAFWLPRVFDSLYLSCLVYLCILFVNLCITNPLMLPNIVVIIDIGISDVGSFHPINVALGDRTMNAIMIPLAAPGNFKLLVDISTQTATHIENADIFASQVNFIIIIGTTSIIPARIPTIIPTAILFICFSCSFTNECFMSSILISRGCLLPFVFCILHLGYPNIAHNVRAMQKCGKLPHQANKVQLGII